MRQMILATCLLIIGLCPRFSNADAASVSITEPLLSFTGHRDVIWAIEFSPDGSTLASASSDETVRLWDVRSGHLQHVLKPRSRVRCLSFSPDGSTLASGQKDSSIQLWDVASGRLRRTFKGYENIDALNWSRDGTMLAAACDMEKGSEKQPRKTAVLLWNPQNGELLRTLVCSGGIAALAFSPDSQTLAMARMSMHTDDVDDGGAIELWSTRDGEVKATWKIYGHIPFGLVFSADGSTLVSANAGFIHEKMRFGEIRLWNVASGQYARPIAVEEAGITRLSLSPDGKYVAGKLARVEGEKGEQVALSQVRVWEIGSGKLVQSFPGDNRVLGAVSFAPDGQTVACAGKDNAVHLWPFSQQP